MMSESSVSCETLLKNIRVNIAETEELIKRGNKLELREKHKMLEDKEGRQPLCVITLNDEGHEVEFSSGAHRAIKRKAGPLSKTRPKKIVCMVVKNMKREPPPAVSTPLVACPSNTIVCLPVVNLISTSRSESADIDDNLIIDTAPSSPKQPGHHSTENAIEPPDISSGYTPTSVPSTVPDSTSELSTQVALAPVTLDGDAINDVWNTTTEITPDALLANNSEVQPTDFSGLRTLLANHPSAATLVNTDAVLPAATPALSETVMDQTIQETALLAKRLERGKHKKGTQPMSMVLRKKIIERMRPPSPQPPLPFVRHRHEPPPNIQAGGVNSGIYVPITDPQIPLNLYMDSLVTSTYVANISYGLYQLADDYSCNLNKPKMRYELLKMSSQLNQVGIRVVSDMPSKTTEEMMEDMQKKLDWLIEKEKQRHNF